MSRVGGGGYAESRGGFGDRTGGGMSGNARDGIGKGGAQQGRGGFSTGMYGATTRRTSVPQREYDMNLNNAKELAKTTVGFMGGPVTTAGKMIAGYGPQFTGYRGMGVGPGSYDPSGMAGGGMYRGATQKQITPNLARAQALGPAAAPAQTAPKEWWRTPFPAPDRAF